MRTTLDEKLNSLPISDELRMYYHQLRCDYKVSLEKLQDVNSQLRQEIIRWQTNLRVKAFRLTTKFNDPAGGYTPLKFFHEFNELAEKDILRFMNEEGITGDSEKLLNGVIFELAAECPLRWNSDDGQ